MVDVDCPDDIYGCNQKKILCLMFVMCNKEWKWKFGLNTRFIGVLKNLTRKCIKTRVNRWYSQGNPKIFSAKTGQVSVRSFLGQLEAELGFQKQRKYRPQCSEHFVRNSPDEVSTQALCLGCFSKNCLRSFFVFLHRK